jgi:hypothetical protein
VKSRQHWSQSRGTGTKVGPSTCTIGCVTSPMWVDRETSVRCNDLQRVREDDSIIVSAPTGTLLLPVHYMDDLSRVSSGADTIMLSSLRTR